MQVKKRGTIAVATHQGIKQISDVLFVPNLNQNLLSVGQMLERKYSLEFKNNNCTIFEPNGAELLKAEMKGKTFTIDWNEIANVCAEIEDLVLWHKRLGHVNHNSLVSMNKQGSVRNLPPLTTKIKVCGVCQQGKQTRLPFQKIKLGEPWRSCS